MRSSFDGASAHGLVSLRQPGLARETTHGPGMWCRSTRKRHLTSLILQRFLPHHISRRRVLSPTYYYIKMSWKRGGIVFTRSSKTSHFQQLDINFHYYTCGPADAAFPDRFASLSETLYQRSTTQRNEMTPNVAENMAVEELAFLSRAING